MIDDEDLQNAYIAGWEACEAQRPIVPKRIASLPQRWRSEIIPGGLLTSAAIEICAKQLAQEIAAALRAARDK